MCPEPARRSSNPPSVHLHPQVLIDTSGAPSASDRRLPVGRLPDDARMCAERRRASRRPSRTTSWSSAIRTVISPFSSTQWDSTSAGGRLPRITRRVPAAPARGPARSGVAAASTWPARARGRPAGRARSPPTRGTPGPRRAARTRAGARASRSRAPRGSARVPGEVRTFAQIPAAPAARASRTTSARSAGSSEGRGGRARARRRYRSRRR